MNAATIHAFFDPATHTVAHLVADPATRRAAVADRVLAQVGEAGLTLDWHLETHAHADHLPAAPYLQQRLGGRIGVGQHIVEVQRVSATLFNAPDIADDGRVFDRPIPLNAL